MYDLPWATHRYFIEPLTESQHVSRTLVKRYMSFIEKIKKSSKSSLKQLLEISKNDVRQTTGHNLRSIMELTGKNTIEELDTRNVDFDYHKVKETDAWRINFAKELVEIRGGDLEVQGIESDELQQILEYICTG